MLMPIHMQILLQVLEMLESKRIFFTLIHSNAILQYFTLFISGKIVLIISMDTI